MNAIDAMLREAMLAHRAGRLLDAEQGYREVLRARPQDARAWHFRALLQFHSGERAAAVRSLHRSLEHEPSNARAWNALGGMLIALDQAADAQHAYRRATQVAPGDAEGWYNLAICERNEGGIDRAVEQLREALRCDPSYFRAHEALAMLFYQLGRMQESAAVYADWTLRDPANPRARYMAAASSGQGAPARAPDEYVRELFEQAAHGFDANLEQLRYRAPQLVATALIERIRDVPQRAVLDAGCGTGLCGVPLRPYCHRLVGVDLSSRMLELARARTCYDELVEAELTHYMRSHPLAFDAVVCADTLVYFGGLEAPFAAAHRALSPGGWLVFTVEALAEPATADHSLQVHGRYAHRESYVRSALADAGFDLHELQLANLREEREQPVAGYRVVAQSGRRANDGSGRNAR